MKIKHHIATGQYEFVEVEFDVNDRPIPNEIKEYDDDLRAAFAPKPINGGIEEREMNGLIDKMLLGQSINGGIELYEKMSQSQKDTVQRIKRSLKRLKANEINHE